MPKKPSLFPRLYSPQLLHQAATAVFSHYTRDTLPAALHEFDRRRAARLQSIADRLRDETYIPQPASLIHIPKPNHPGETRPISLLDVDDRVVLSALHLSLAPIVDRLLLPGCFAYRPHRSANAAIEHVRRAFQSGVTHAAAGDIDDFFANIDRALLLNLIRQRIWETPIINLLEAFLHIGAVRELDWVDSGKGIAQGSPLSPVLSNLYLLSFDRLLQNSGVAWARYADNILLLADNPDRLRHVFQLAEAHLADPCQLRLNDDSRVFTAVADGFEFLGLFCKPNAITMAPARVTQKRASLAAICKANPSDLKKLVAALTDTIRGWRNYYGTFPAVRPQMELLQTHLADLLVPWLANFRSLPANRRLASAELKAQLIDLILPVPSDQRLRIKWIELILSRSRPKSESVPGLSPAATRAVRLRKQELAERKEQLEEIVVTKPGVYLGRTGERLVIRRDGKREAEIPFSLVRNITFLTTAVSLSGELMIEAAARGIPIMIAGHDGRAAVRIGPPDLPAHELAFSQSAIAASPAGLALARIIVAGKIRNQINLLRYFLKYPERQGAAKFLQESAAAVSAMEAVIDELRARRFSDDLDLERNRLFAAEGQAASSYWAAARSLLHYKPGFEKRVHRGAADLVNSLLNYGYGILYSRLWVLLAKAGLNVNIGFLHKPQPGKAGLLYDFIEEFRAPAVDRTVFALLNLDTTLKVGEQGLDADSRQLLAKKVLERLRTGVRYHGETVPLQKVMELQVQLLVRHVQGREEYKTFVLPW